MNKTSAPPREQALLFSDSGEERAARTRNSVLWAAYGDALGFISELVDNKGGLERRTKGAALDGLMAWKRRVGGKGGIELVLPAGCWSDDTQLRMAVSRAINRHGFDIESFSRVELPVWPSYALGGGRASKAAAASLGKPDCLWYANTFDGWTDAGGNGAAMRIQPHVWSSGDLDGDYLLDVVTDSICTHGHPRAIIGACFHAATLAHCIRVGSVPDVNTRLDIASTIGGAVHLIEHHRSLGSTWLGLWEQTTGRTFRDEWHATVDELRGAIEDAAVVSDAMQNVSGIYRAVVEKLGLRVRERRGNGILTSVAAVALAGISPTASEAVIAAANALGTDTDTIGTMTGALLGACDPAQPTPQEPLDSPYLITEADRLVAISRGGDVQNHSYPDLLTWVAPQTQADALVSSNSGLVVEGLGPVTELGVDASWTARKDFAWQWVRTDFGQTLLIKRRPRLRTLGAGNNLAPPPPPPIAPPSRRAPKHREQDSDDLARRDRGVNLDAAVEYARQHLSDNRELGYTLRRVARDGTLTDLVAFVAAVRGDLRR